MGASDRDGAREDRDRAGASDRLVRWLLLDGQREVVAGALLLLVLGTLLGLGVAGVVDATDRGAVRTVGGGLIPGLFTFLSIVIAINQLVLSQEFGTAAEIGEQVRDVRDFRREVEREAGRAPSPVLPTAFLAMVVDAVAQDAASLRAGATADLPDELREAVERYAGTVERTATDAAAALDRSEPGRSSAVLTVLEYPDAVQLTTARRLRTEYEDALPPDLDDALADLVEALALFDVARTHFRSTYTQRVLARLSRRLLYLGFPAIVTSFVLVLLSWDVAPAPIDAHRLLVVAALLTVALSPLALLLAYVLRIATVSERTVGVGPFVSRPDESGRGERPRRGESE